MSFVFLAVTSGSVTVASFVSRIAALVGVINIPIILLFAAGNRLVMKNSVKVWWKIIEPNIKKLKYLQKVS